MPLLCLSGTVPATHPMPSCSYSTAYGWPRSFPGLRFLVGWSTLGCLAAPGQPRYLNSFALLTLLSLLLHHASRSRKPRQDTSRRYCMGPAPPYPPIQIPSSFVTIYGLSPAHIPGTISALASSLRTPPSCSPLSTSPVILTPPQDHLFNFLLRLHPQSAISPFLLSPTALHLLSPSAFPEHLLLHTCFSPADHPTCAHWLFQAIVCFHLALLLL